MEGLDRPVQQRTRRRLLSTTVAGLAAGCVVAPPACAFEIETPNPDIAMRLDTQVRYALGVRGERINPASATVRPSMKLSTASTSVAR